MFCKLATPQPGHCNDLPFRSEFPGSHTGRKYADKIATGFLKSRLLLRIESDAEVIILLRCL